MRPMSPNVRVKVGFRQWQLWCRSRRGAGIRDARLLRYAASEMEGMTSAPAAGTTIAVARTQIRSRYPPPSSTMANFGGSSVCQTSNSIPLRQSYHRRPLTAHLSLFTTAHHSTFTTRPAITAAHRPPPPWHHAHRALHTLPEASTGQVTRPTTLRACADARPGD